MTSTPTDPARDAAVVMSDSDITSMETVIKYDKQRGYYQADIRPEKLLLLISQYRTLQRQLAGAREALTIIRDNYGHVCGEYTECDHASCRDSYSAWSMAAAALAALDFVAAGDDDLKGI